MGQTERFHVPKTTAELAAVFDHTLLKPDATAAQVESLCREAAATGFASVCVNSRFVPTVARMLIGSGVKTCCVVGFPLGAASSRAKAAETAFAVEEGAQEIDMVIAVGALKAGDLDAVRNDIAAVVKAAHPRAIVKVILETCLLTDEEKRTACRLSVEAGADFVKTSTGFSTGGATVEDIRLMRREVGPDIGVKASGGIRDLSAALAMLEAGASRIGASASVAIVKEFESRTGGADRG
ncbi:MAG: deoxyribose-phosphate aldolase [Clostridia bacterium]|nr:deoxyribose-phosphate aldolase [Clostridia bacterium]